MKNVLKTIFISLFVMLAVSCGGDLYQKTSISVTLPGASSRAAVTEQLDYVLTVTSETDTTAEPITKTGVTGDTLTVEVAVGTYTVDLKAYAEDDTEHAKLLYEAIETGVEVVQDEVKSVTLTLKSVAAADDDSGDDNTEVTDDTDKKTDETADDTDKKTEETTDDTDKKAEETTDDTDKKTEETTDDTDKKAEEVTKVTSAGMTVKATEAGFEITVTHTAENKTWTWAKVTEKSSKTVYDLYNSISKLNNNESVTFTYPFVTKDTEYQFAFTNDDVNVEEYCTAVKAIGGLGPLDYSVFDTLEPSLTDGDNQEHYVNVANLKAETTDFIKDYSNIQFFFKLWSGETDFSNTAWVYERYCTTTIPTDKPQLYYYNDLLTNGKFNFYDPKYEWDDSDTVNTGLSARTNYFVEIGYYFNVDSADQAGRFATKSILSTAVKYNALIADGSANVSVGVAIPNFTVEGTSAIEYADKEYTYTATPKSGAFVTGTVFAWYINGCTIEGANSSTITINPVKLTGMQADSNILTCMASYGEVLKSAYISLAFPETSSDETTTTESINTGIVLWNNSSSESRYMNREIVTTEVDLGINIFSSINGDESISEADNPTMLFKPADGEKEFAGAFCFDYSTGDIYLTTFDESDTSIHEYCSKNNTVTDIDVTVPNLVTSMGKLGNYLYTFSQKGNALNKIDLTSKTISGLSMNAYMGSNESSMLISITSDGEYIYAISSDSTTSGEINYSIQKVDVNGNLISSNNFWTLSYSDYLITTTDVTDYPSIKVNAYNFRIRDIQASDNYIYVLFADTATKNGGLIRINKNTLKNAKFENETYILGFYKDSNPLNEDATNYFSIPGKFIAKKPDVLYISDESVYTLATENGEKYYSTNRVITVNLSESSLTSIDVDVTFDNYASDSSFYSYLSNY